MISGWERSLFLIQGGWLPARPLHASEFQLQQDGRNMMVDVLAEIKSRDPILYSVSYLLQL